MAHGWESKRQTRGFEVKILPLSWDCLPRVYLLLMTLLAPRKNNVPLLQFGFDC